MEFSPVRPGQRAAHRAAVLRVLLREGPLARVDLAARVGLTPAAISNITRDLLEDGWLRKAGTSRDRRVGANAILLDLPDDFPALGAVHQGVSALRIGLCTLRGRVVARRIVPTPQPYSPDWVATTVAETLRDLLRTAGHPEQSLLAVGAGLVGLMDVRRGMVRRAPNLGWQDVPIRDLLAREIGCPVAIENNVRAMAAGEALLGNGRDWPDFTFVYVGTGIGSGIVIDGRPYRGVHGGAGELGHITVDPVGVPCRCGNRGCLETVAAEPALLDRARRLGVHLPPASADPKDGVRALAARARDGDAAAIEVVATCGQSLGVALADLVDVFDPGRVVLHGAITEAGSLFFDSVAQALRQRAFVGVDQPIELPAPTFGNDAGVVGGAATALDAIILADGAAAPGHAGTAGHLLIRGGASGRDR